MLMCVGIDKNEHLRETMGRYVRIKSEISLIIKVDFVCFGFYGIHGHLVSFLECGKLATFSKIISTE